MYADERDFGVGFQASVKNVHLARHSVLVGKSDDFGPTGIPVLAASPVVTERAVSPLPINLNNGCVKS